MQYITTYHRFTLWRRAIYTGEAPALTRPLRSTEISNLEKMSYRFLGLDNELDPQLGQDLSVLSKFSVEQLREFASLIVSWVIAPKASDIKASVAAFASTHSIDGSTIKASMRGLLMLVKGALKYNVTPQQLKGDLVALGMATAGAETIEKVWRGNYMDLARSATVQTMTIKSLQNMEWKFGVTASSEELDTVGNTFLQMKFTLASGSKVDTNKSEQVHVEMSLPQFYDLLSKMELAKAEMDARSEVWLLFEGVGVGGWVGGKQNMYE